MKVMVCVNNRVLAEGVKEVISRLLPEAVVGDFHFGPPLDEPELILFASRDDLDELKRTYASAKYVAFDQGMADTEIACLLYYHGVLGIISSDLSLDRFAKALKKIAQGEIWLDQKHLHLLLQQQQSAPDLQNRRRLSAQDQRIVQLVAGGASNREIAAELCLSVATVKAHLSRLFRWLNVENRSQLAVLATRGLDLAQVEAPRSRRTKRRHQS